MLVNAHAIGVGFCVEFDNLGCREPQNSNETNKSPRFELKTSLVRTFQDEKMYDYES